MTSIRRCWCGNAELKAFSAQYRRCAACETLVARQMPDPQMARVDAEERHFYGRNYWFAYQEKELGLPNIVDRTRSDLYDRCPHWLNILLKYLHPPAKVLELGSGNGSFAFLMRCVGFDVTGLELSPWLAEYVQNTYEVPMRVGPIEEQRLSAGSLDAIVMMDVLEHLENPLKTLQCCAEALTPKGLLMVQTPCYPEGRSMKALAAGNSRFPEVMRDRGHLLLFSRTSAARLMQQAGFEHLYFEPAVFAHYDMSFIASRTPQKGHARDATDRLLEQTPQGRLVRGLIDLKNAHDRLAGRLEFIEPLMKYFNAFGGQYLLKAIQTWQKRAGRAK